ncbi:hypothetical protein M0802_003487 [Mischocyttarus mexicanus]|nr:hypothetical protein M0802_003487 [Mischocyttarus mexicanus]
MKWQKEGTPRESRLPFPFEPLEASPTRVDLTGVSCQTYVKGTCVNPICCTGISKLHPIPTLLTYIFTQ